MRTIQLLDLADALMLQQHLLGIANDDGLNPVAICIVDARGVQLTAVTMSGTKTPSIKTAHDKAVTAVEFERDTIEFTHRQHRGLWMPDAENGWSPADIANAMKISPIFVSWGGGAVVRSPLDGSIIGAIGVSNRTELEDHELASRRPASWDVCKP